MRFVTPQNETVVTAKGKIFIRWFGKTHFARPVDKRVNFNVLS